jgi:hypothetical protein
LPFLALHERRMDQRVDGENRKIWIPNNDWHRYSSHWRCQANTAESIKGRYHE